MCGDEALQQVFRAVVISVVCYASSASRQFTSAVDRQHSVLEACLGRSVTLNIPRSLIGVLVGIDQPGRRKGLPLMHTRYSKCVQARAWTDAHPPMSASNQIWQTNNPHP